MAAKLQPEDGDANGEENIFAEINITPLTDVFLVLLIIFMLSALATQIERQEEQKQVAEVQKKEEQKEEAEKKSGLKVNLPSGAAQEIDLTKKSLILMIPVNGDVNVNGTSVPDAKIDDMFRRAFLDDKNTQVVIQADKGVQHGRVVNIMERAKQSGLTRLAIGTTAGK